MAANLKADYRTVALVAEMVATVLLVELATMAAAALHTTQAARLAWLALTHRQVTALMADMVTALVAVVLSDRRITVALALLVVALVDGCLALKPEEASSETWFKAARGTVDTCKFNTQTGNWRTT